MKFPNAYPAVVGTLSSPGALRLLAKVNLPCDAVEVRVDALLAAGSTVETIEAALLRRKHPVLLTLRIAVEGGKRAWKPAERRALFLRLLPQVEAVDVELATISPMKAVIEAARASGKTLVLSAHALKQPATPALLAKLAGSFTPETHTIFKVAGQIKTWRDLQRLAGLLVNHPESKVAVMGLGPHAAQSRAALVALGSRLAYGYLDEPAAPGQPSAVEVRKMVQSVRDLGG